MKILPTPSVSFFLTKWPIVGCCFLISITACQPDYPESKKWQKPSFAVLGCENYQTILTQVDTQDAALYNNVWNKEAAKEFAWTQCLIEHPQDGKKGWYWRWPDSGQNIFAYPQIKTGSSPWAPLPRVGSLPLPVNSIGRLDIRHQVEISAWGEHNVATSMWLTNTANIGDEQNKNVIVAEVMIWTFATANHLNPAGKKVKEVVVNGEKWSVWYEPRWQDASGQNDNTWLYLTFVREQQCLNCNYDVIALLNTIDKDTADFSTLFIADVELGTEIMRGEGVLWVKSFSVEPALK